VSIVFPLGSKPVGGDVLWTPYVPVALKGSGAWVTVTFLLDTGADCTVVPRGVAEELGIDLASCPPVVMQGIECGTVDARRAVLEARIGEVPFRMTCLVSASDETPYLLGRLDLFDRFSIEIDNSARVLRLKPIPVGIIPGHPGAPGAGTGPG
jgi:predicted aspartyl protease